LLASASSFASTDAIVIFTIPSRCAAVDPLQARLSGQP
jgi:hypothetical protein